jgi:hypothetical protein
MRTYDVESEYVDPIVFFIRHRLFARIELFALVCPCEFPFYSTSERVIYRLYR